MVEQKIISRLSLLDYVLGMIDGFGYHFPMQLVAICQGQVDRDFLENLNSQLTQTSLAKLVKKSRVPLARDYWVPLPDWLKPTVFIDNKVIDKNRLQQWLCSQVSDLTPVIDAPGWKISAVNLDDDQYVVAVLLSHQLVDAHGAFAVARQLSSGNLAQLPLAETASLRSDLAMVCRQPKLSIQLGILKTISRINTQLVRLRRSEEVSFDPSVTLLFDYTNILRIAEKFGGSFTSLGTALSANIAHATLRKRNDFIMVPVKGDDPRSNSVKTAFVDLRGISYPITDLALIKSRAKGAYAASSVITSMYAHKKSCSVFSNPGQMPDALADVFPGISIAFARAIGWHNNDRLIFRQKSIMCTSTIFNNTVALTVTALNSINRDTLLNAIEQELARFEIVPFQEL